MTRPSGGGLRNEVEQSRLLPMILAHAAFVAAILNEKTGFIYRRSWICITERSSRSRWQNDRCSSWLAGC
jgi:hypothetical protein